jgi:hypothetical protein
MRLLLHAYVFVDRCLAHLCVEQTLVDLHSQLHDTDARAAFINDALSMKKNKPYGAVLRLSDAIGMYGFCLGELGATESRYLHDLQHVRTVSLCL